MNRHEKESLDMTQLMRKILRDEELQHKKFTDFQEKRIAELKGLSSNTDPEERAAMLNRIKDRNIRAGIVDENGQLKAHYNR